MALRLGICAWLFKHSCRTLRDSLALATARIKPICHLRFLFSYVGMRLLVARVQEEVRRVCSVRGSCCYCVNSSVLIESLGKDQDEQRLEILGEGEWVSGIVVLNPFCRRARSAKTKLPKWVPDMVDGGEYLICRLRSWHELSNVKSSYELWDFQTAWTSDALIVCAVADWTSENSDELTPNLVLSLNQQLKVQTAKVQ